MSVESTIRDMWQRYTDGDIDAESAGSSAYTTLEVFLDGIETGEYRAAERGQRRGPSGWMVNEWVKQGILLCFSLHETTARIYGDVTYNDVLPLRDTNDLGTRGTRNTPDGTVIRRGAYLGSDCIMMSPSFVNIGAHVGDGSLIDSCDTVGSCAQIGENVKIGANTLIGGVLEPVEDAPVIIESNVSLGAGCRVTSGFHIGENSIIGENTLLTPRIPVYDLVEEDIHYGHLPADRRAFTRYVESSLGDHDLFESGAYKPAVVALDIEDETLDRTQREEALRE
ncbi:MAG: tetrahydrodipicolinate N-succinyltransferase [Haloquadratum sp. J07HQX50]|nr:MAG: tetrahydrodipicolinate N-succinyltransferase [Haloquadratum sp. J07HQX50]